MVFQSLRSGWPIAILTFLFCASLLGQTDPRMVVAWDPIPPGPDGTAAKYRIETTVGALPFALAKECPIIPVYADGSIACEITDIEGTTTYKIRVAGVEENGAIGEYSDTISFMFASVQPLSPTSLSQSSIPNSPGKIGKKLTWPAVTKYRTGPLITGAIEYRVYQAMTGPAVVIATATTTSFSVQLAKHKSYQFYVTCVVDGVESFTSPAVRINT